MLKMASDVRIFLLIFLSTAFASRFKELTGFGLKFTHNPEPNNILQPGSSVMLHCSTNIPADGIDWHLNHHPINESMIISQYESNESVLSYTHPLPYVIRHYENYTSSLKIYIDETPWLYEQKIGIYQCIARVGSIKLASAASRLDVAVIHAAGGAGSIVEAVPDQAILLPCPEVISVPRQIVKVMLNGQALNNESVVITNDGKVILLPPIKSGIYDCINTNTALNASVSHLVSVSVDGTTLTQLTVLSPTKSRIIANEGDTLQLQCLVTGMNLLNTWWTREDGSHIHDSVSHKQSAMVSMSSLTLTHIHSSNAGTYTCHGRTASSKSSTVSKATQLYVQTMPVIEQGLVSASLKEGDRLAVRCKVQGHPLPVLHWLTNGETLLPAPGVNITTDGWLIIEEITKDYAGVLQCFAHNSVGSTSSGAFFTVIPHTVQQMTPQEESLGTQLVNKPRVEKKRVNNKPGAPSAPSVSKVGQTTVEVCWKQPAQEPLNNTVLFYKVQYRMMEETSSAPSIPGLNFPPAGSTWWTDDTIISPGTLCHTISHLTGNIVYRFRVAVVYSTHESVEGKPSKRFLLTKDPPLLAPPAPTLQQTLSHGNGSAFLQWVYNAQVPVEGFIVSYTKWEDNKATETHQLRYIGKLRRNITISELPVNVKLTIAINAFNIAGKSPPSNTHTLYVTHDIYYEDSMEGIIKHPVLLSDSQGDNAIRYNDNKYDSPEDDDDDYGIESDEHDVYNEQDHSKTRPSTGLSSFHLFIVFICILAVLLLIVLLPSTIRLCRRKLTSTSAVQVITVECPVTGGCEVVTPLQLSQLCQSDLAQQNDNPRKQEMITPDRSLLNQPD